MRTLTYHWTDERQSCSFELVSVVGTKGAPYVFGDQANGFAVDVPDFFMATVPITQRVWIHVTGSNPAIHRGPELPMENVSWNDLTQPGGFLQQLNESAVAESLRDQADRPLEFRLPSETEWEYAARGGQHWRNAYRYSGSNDIDTVAWYDRRHGDHTQRVALKSPNQLGLYDMSGNVWEWCEDTYSPDLHCIPRNGAPCELPGDERVLRGGCFHNWAIHCTVSKRYEIARTFHDGCIGFRVVLTEPRRNRRS